MAHLRLERVPVDVRRLANDLVAYVGVANDGVSCLDSLQDGGGRCDRVHGGRLRHQALAVHGGHGGHRGHGGQGGHCGRVGGRIGGRGHCRLALGPDQIGSGSGEGTS